MARSADDWREAFGHHPKIGDREAPEAVPATHHFAAEQVGVAGATEDVLEALAEGNRAYEEFGYIFIVCATGLTAEEMLERLRARLPNDPDVETGIARGSRRRSRHSAARDGANPGHYLT